jgi:cytoskeleton protein RodZ
VTDQTDLYRNDAPLEPVDVNWVPVSTENQSACAAESPTRVLAAASLDDLVRAREAIGFRASDVASMLGMATRQIDAIERADWKALPGQAFIRSAIRAYGKAVGTDVGPLLATIGGGVPAPALKPVPSLKDVVPKGGFLGFSAESSGSRIAWIVVGLAAIVAIAFHFGGGVDGVELGERSARLKTPAVPGTSPAPVAAAGGQSGRGSQTGTARVSPPTVSPPASIAEPVRAAAPAVTEATRGDPVKPGITLVNSPMPPSAPMPPFAPMAPASAASALSSAAAAPREAQSASPVTVPASPVAGAPAVSADPSVEVLVFRFDQESWVEIRESGGKVVHLGLQPAGTSLERSGRKPLALVVGNAAHVKLERNGAPVDLSTRSPAGVARFMLD